MIKYFRTFQNRWEESYYIKVAQTNFYKSEPACKVEVYQTMGISNDSLTELKLQNFYPLVANIEDALITVTSMCVNLPVVRKDTLTSRYEEITKEQFEQYILEFKQKLNELFFTDTTTEQYGILEQSFKNGDLSQEQTDFYTSEEDRNKVFEQKRLAVSKIPNEIILDNTDDAFSNENEFGSWSYHTSKVKQLVHHANSGSKI